MNIPIDSAKTVLFPCGDSPVQAALTGVAMPVVIGDPAPSPLLLYVIAPLCFVATFCWFAIVATIDWMIKKLGDVFKKLRLGLSISCEGNRA